MCVLVPGSFTMIIYTQRCPVYHLLLVRLVLPALVHRHHRERLVLLALLHHHHKDVPVEPNRTHQIP